MALHYLTPTEQVLAQFSSEEQSRLSAAALENLYGLEKKNHHLFHYHLPAYAKQKLSEKGLYLSPYPYETHSHPVCKTLESYLINVKLINYIDDSFNFVGFKNRKMQILRKASKIKIADFLNRYVVSHDVQRYGADAYFQTAKEVFPSTYSKGRIPHHVASIIPSCIKKKKRRVFLYDELHYWTLKDIYIFLDIVRPEIMIGSFVFPKEALFGCKESLNPWAYEFKIEGDTLVFAPDGIWSESYEQPMEAGKLLLVNRIQVDGVSYSVQVKDSIYAHCIVIITRTDMPADKFRFFSDFDACSGKELLSSHGRFISSKIIPVRCETVLSVFKYLRTLKKPDLQSAMAKHRQLVNEPSGREVRFIEDLSKFFLDHHEKLNLIENGYFTSKIEDFFLKLPDFLKIVLGGFKDLTLGSFIENLKPLLLQVKCVTYDPVFFVDFSVSDCLFSGESGRKEIAEPPLSLANRASSPYCLSKENFSLFSPFVGTPFSDAMLLEIFKSVFSFCLRRGYRSLLLKLRNTLLRGSERIFFDSISFSLPLKYLVLLESLNFKTIVRFALVAIHFLLASTKSFSFVPLLQDETGALYERCQQNYYSLHFEHADAMALVLNELKDVCEVLPACVESECCNKIVICEVNEAVDSPPPSCVNSSIDVAPLGEEVCISPIVENVELCRASDVVVNGCSVLNVTEPNFCRLSFFDVPRDGNCFWHAIAPFFHTDAETLKEKLFDLLKLHEFDNSFSSKEQLMKFEANGVYADLDIISFTCFKMGIELLLEVKELDNSIHQIQFLPTKIDNSTKMICFAKLDKQTEHFMSALPKEGCTLRAIAACLEQSPNKVLAVISEFAPSYILDELKMGFGLPKQNLAEIFEIFDIKATLHGDGGFEVLNENASRDFHFALSDSHIEFIPNFKGSLSSKTSSDLLPGIKSADDYQKFFSEHLNCVDFEPSFQRASLLNKSLMQGTTGKISSELFDKQTDLLKNSKAQSARKVFVSVGVPGSGKSYGVIKYIKENLHRKIFVISPRKNLKEAFLKSLGLNFSKKESLKVNVEVLTFEVALKRFMKFSNCHIFLDEFQLFPPGYLDLLCFICGKNVNFAVMGDPCQSSYDSDSDRSVFSESLGNFDSLLGDKSYQFLCTSWRFNNPIFEGRLPCLFKSETLVMNSEPWVSFDDFKSYASSDESKMSEVVLVSSFIEKKVVNINLGLRQKVFTFGESTGLTFNYCTVLITADSSLADEKRWLVALTRARKNIFFINISGMSLQDFSNSLYPSVVNSFFTARSTVDQLKKFLPGKPTMVKKFSKIGRDEMDREERLSGDPWLKSKIFLGERTEVVENLPEPSQLQPFSMKMHCPVGINSSAYVEISEKMRAREHREKRIGDIVTEQFAEQNVKGGLELTNHCDNFAAIYPRHKAGDTATFVLAAKKRLNFSIPQVEAAKFRSALPTGYIMLAEFLKRVKLRSNWNVNLFESAVSDFEEKKLLKSQATIANHAGRSDPDWPIEQALIFMKSQLCTKFDNRFIDAKAGQTLACFHHDVLVRLAPFIRYIEKKVLEVLPKNLYIHTGKNFDDLNEWVIKNDFSSVCTESDYTAFDASQDATILAFEVLLMKYLNIPSELIEDYKYLKIHTHSKLGMFAVMRFTGEAPTFLFNTLANMVFTFMRYDINGKESICFAGDDMCANKRLRVTNKFEDVLKRLKLKAKVQFVDKPTFCGWCLSSFGIFKRPSLVRERFMIALTADRQKIKLSECIDNYALEVSYAYKLSERLVSLMTEKELEDHFHCVRLIIKNLSLCKSDVSEIFKKKERCLSPERAV